MVVVKIQCGLGNQMFQYAFAKSLKKRGFEVVIESVSFIPANSHEYYALDKYNIQMDKLSKKEYKSFLMLDIFSKIARRFGKRWPKIIRETCDKEYEDYVDIKDGYYIEGFFQDERYFKSLKDELVNDFMPNFELSSYAKNIKQSILKDDKSVFMHIRRGDYLIQEKREFHGVCSLEYYEKAMKYLEKRVENPRYFIFSNDITWAKENLKIKNAFFIENIEKRPPHEDIYLMNLCSHSIIANSSYSWWGAWLSQNENHITICPKHWYKDRGMVKKTQGVICEGWIAL